VPLTNLDGLIVSPDSGPAVQPADIGGQEAVAPKDSPEALPIAE